MKKSKKKRSFKVGSLVMYIFLVVIALCEIAFWVMGSYISEPSQFKFPFGKENNYLIVENIKILEDGLYGIGFLIEHSERDKSDVKSFKRDESEAQKNFGNGFYNKDGAYIVVHKGLELAEIILLKNDEKIPSTPYRDHLSLNEINKYGFVRFDQKYLLERGTYRVEAKLNEKMQNLLNGDIYLWISYKGPLTATQEKMSSLKLVLQYSYAFAYIPYRNILLIFFMCACLAIIFEKRKFKGVRAL